MSLLLDTSWPVVPTMPSASHIPFCLAPLVSDFGPSSGSETIIEFDIGGEIFTAKGLIVEQLNYLEVYPYDRWVDKELPNFHQGEEIMPSGPYRFDLDVHFLSIL